MFKNVYSLYSAFFTQPAFYSQSAVCILHSVCILPLVRSLRFTLTDNKLFKSADKECLILVPRSDLFRPRDFYGFDRFETSHFLHN